ncbi:MAG: hypothetical protein MJ092_06570 [Lachnospiraceae bacterium]|nr:hypothetical protein [Lachnospiraceae bacterium]
MSKKSKIIKTVVFMILFLCSFLVVQKLFRVGEISNAAMHKSFYKEKDESLDAVYIGSSVTYSFWNPLLAWEQTGYTVFSYSTSLMPVEAFQTILQDIRSSQPDALYIVALNPFEKNDLSFKSVHFLVDYYPDIPKKVQYIHDVTSLMPGSVFDKLEYYFPIIRFHSHLADVDEVFLTEDYPDYKGSMNFAYYLMAAEDYSPITEVVKKETPISEERAAILTDFLDYCKEENLNVLFVVSPQPASPVEEQEHINWLASKVEEAGFPVVHLQNPVEEMQLDMTCDYFDRVHSNIHGSIKFTSMLSDYLTEHYNFTDKKGTEEGASWEKSYLSYLPSITPYTLDFERDFSRRDNTLAATEIIRVEDLSNGVRMEWEPVPEAENYHLYRKIDEGDWERIADLSSSTYSYTDTGMNKKHNNTYLVVASRMEGGERIYGNCDYTGYSVIPPQR